MSLRFWHVNEDGLPIARYQTLQAAAPCLDEFPNDSIVVVVADAPLDNQLWEQSR